MPTASAFHDVQATMKAMQANFGGLGQAGGKNQESAPLHFAPPTVYTGQANFTAAHAAASRKPGTGTISPHQAHFGSASVSHESHSADSNMHSASSSTFDPWGEDADEGNPAHKRRRQSAETQFDGVSPPTQRRPMGRRRTSEDVEPGSARAVYLEKNRKAASKCRTKQKMQQEDLVETARDFERKNKQLRAEVDFLKADMRELMDMVGKHAGCPDKRLQTYVQHEADRLVAQDKNNMVAQLLSSGSCDSASLEES